MGSQMILCAILMATCLAQCSRALEIFGPKVSAMDVSKNPSYSGELKGLEEPFLEAMKHMIREDPTKKHAHSLLSGQESYDFTSLLSTIDLLYRSGFNYELYNSTSSDGYITQLVRIINPKAKRSSMKLPPVVLYAGQSTSPAAFLMTAIGRGQPLPWPRDEEWPAAGLEGNRSLALVMSNNGYDVWLVPARGVDLANRDRVAKSNKQADHNQKTDQLKKLFGSLLAHASGKLNGVPNAPKTGHEGSSGLLAKVHEAREYWSFSDDEIVQFEFGHQLELVLNVTGCPKLSLINYSSGGFIAFAFMAHKPEFARRHLDTIISIAPAVFVDKFNLVLGASGILSALTLPSQPFPTDAINNLARKGFAHLCRPKSVRYSVCKMALDQLYGHSDMFNTHLELSIIDYIGRPLSARSLRQTLQAGFSGHLRHYDNGPLGNLAEYNQPKAPAYELSSIKHPRIFIFSGGKDSIVSDKSITKLIGELHQEPEKWVNIPSYNHLDLLAGHDNTERVNLPILHILDDRNLEANYYHEDAFGSEVATFGYNRARAAGRVPMPPQVQAVAEQAVEQVGSQLASNFELEPMGQLRQVLEHRDRDRGETRLPFETDETRPQPPGEDDK